MKKSAFEKDFALVADQLPKLAATWSVAHKLWIIRGSVDICDVDGNYWDTFDVAVLVPKGYPYVIPLVVETSTKIPREIDWHISREGVCCLDEEHVFLAWSKRGIRIHQFLIDKVYPYFANQLYKLQAGKYAGSEYAHFSAGVLQYYQEELKIDSAVVVLAFISTLITGKVGRNNLCPCMSGAKVKKCHDRPIQSMMLFGREKLIKDKEKVLEAITAASLG